MKHLIAIIINVITCPGQILFLEMPVIVKKDTISIFECWAIAIADNSLWLMDEKGDWHELSEQDANAELVIDALYERLTESKMKAA